MTLPNPVGLPLVTDFGAVGDGTTDDTRAVQRAIDHAAEKRQGLWFPAGTYACSRLTVPSHTALMGAATWSYHHNCSATLKAIDPDQPCLLDLTGSIGARVRGICLDGAKLGTSMAGIFLDGHGHKEEETLVIEDCRVSHFTGDAVTLRNVWGYTVRDCMMIFNGGNGLTITRWDGWIHDNIFNNNDGYGIAFMRPNGACTILGNRIEWNHAGGLYIEQGHNFNIGNNYFDRSGGPAVTILGEPTVKPGVIAMTGNVLHRSGARADPDTHACSHLLMRHVDGAVVSGNTLLVGANDSGAGQRSPSFGFVLESLRDCIVSGNVCHKGAITEMLVDLGGHEQCRIEPPLGRVWSDWRADQGESVT